MPVLLLAAVPLLIIADAPTGLVGAVILGVAVMLGAMGATIAWMLGKAMVRGDAELADTAWFLRVLVAERGRCSAWPEKAE